MAHLSAKSIREKIKQLDEMLDSEKITEDEYERIDKQVVCLYAELARAEREEECACIEEKRVSQWEASFLESFDIGTHAISNKQAECFHRINRGNPFRHRGKLYSCTGPNYRTGFAHVVVEQLVGGRKI